MSIPKEAKLAKLLISILLNEKNLFYSVFCDLQEKFEITDTVSSWLNFDYTNYYEPEMGTPLFRRIITFKKLIKQSDLAEIKNFTNLIELKYLQNSKRLVNIDPGYILGERFVLATGKNYSHRIFIGNGIYADLTLIYQNKSFNKLPWTYPDYASPQILNWLEKIRNKYLQDSRKSITHAYLQSSVSYLKNNAVKKARA